MDQPEGDADQYNDHSAHQQLSHRLGKFDGVESVPLRFLHRQACADGQDTTGHANSCNDQKGDEIRDTHIVSGGNQQAGNRAKDLHHNKNQEDLIDHGDKSREEGLMVEHRIQNVVNEIDGDCARDHQEKDGDVAVGYDFPLGN